MADTAAIGNEVFDLLVVGGGINGAGIARDAAGRGLRGAARASRTISPAHTSSASTKLIHGGLRYLEHYEFRLVRKALRSARCCSMPRRTSSGRCASCCRTTRTCGRDWMIRAGLFLYDHLARRRRLPGSRGDRPARGTPQARRSTPRFRRGFVYSDGWVDDARLVVLNAVDARERGADGADPHALQSARARRDGWRATLAGARTGRRRGRARARWSTPPGPGSAEFLRDRSPRRKSRHGVRLVKGSHIVVPRLFDHELCLHLPERRTGASSSRSPTSSDFTLIGTTDVEYHGDPARVRDRRDEIDYLCEHGEPLLPSAAIAPRRRRLELRGRAAAARRRVRRSVQRDARLHARTRQRPARRCCRCSAARSRPFAALAEEARRPARGRRSAASRRDPGPPARPLPGGDMPRRRLRALPERLATRYPWLPAPLRHRYARAYGTRIARAARRRDASGRSRRRACCRACTPREIEYLRRQEWARTARGYPLAPQQARPAPAAAAATARRLDRRAPRLTRGRRRLRRTAMSRFVLALDQGTTSSRSILFDHAGAHRRGGAARVHAALPAAGLGRARRRRRSGPRRRRRSPRCWRARASTAAEIAAVGITNQRETTVLWDRRTRRAGRRRRSSGRTVARPSAATHCARAGHEPRGGARAPACCSTRISPAPSSPGCSTTCRARARAPSAASWRSARSTAGSRGSSPAGASTSPTRRNASRTLLYDLDTGDWSDADAGAARHARGPACRASCPRPGTPARSRAIDGPRGAAGRASPATSRPRCSARPASRRAWPRTPTAPAASC